MAPKMGKGGQIWLKCIAGDLIMVIRDKNNIFERVENFHADLAWNYPFVIFGRFRNILKIIEEVSMIDAVYFHLVEEAC